MSRFRKYPIRYALGVLAILSLALQPAVAQTLYEQYAMASKAELEPETREMGKQLTSTFDANAINRKRQQIDFAKYFSNLKKLVVYGAKLSTYSEYEKDLNFARDNEIFKGLPEETPERRNGVYEVDKRQFVDDKYTSMKGNVEQEIDTYRDLILTSLDVCEYLTDYDLSELLSNPEYSDRIERLMRTEEYGIYQTKRNRLKAGWPGLEGRIAAQFSLWGARPASPDEPIISMGVTGAL